VDPFTASVLSAAAGQLLADGVSKASRVMAGGGGTALPAYDAQAPLFDEHGDLAVILEGSQADAVNEFLGDPRVRVLAESRALAPIVVEPNQLDGTCAAMSEAFLDLATSVVPNVDRATWQLIWSRFEGELEATFATPALSGALMPEHHVALQSASAVLVIDSRERARVPIWLRDLADLASKPEVLRETQLIASDICRAVVSEFEDLRFEHAMEDVRRPLRDLYVERNLLRADNGKHQSSADLFAADTYARAVVTGAPGAGKTTLTQHVLHGAGDSGTNAVPLRARAREINLDTELLIDEIAAAIRRDFQLAAVTPETIDTLLTLGRAFVVFDGIDEVLSLPARKKLAAKIETFSKRYPMSTILVTSRDVGYEQAAVSSDIFTRFKLLPFDDGQVREYAKKWFSGTASSTDLVSSFLNDLEAVPDLRENPLMLSLLCTLYKARREIPRNRRQVYNQCAELLFKRWDSLRDIDQPVDHVEHGHDLIQEIALWYFKSKTVQRGVEEKQLQGIIAAYLMDSAGVLAADAKHRAREFVEFCAGRAWLLGYTGSSPAGERLFIFTHRTFMEFFAAEGLARNIGAPEELATIVCEAYKENASSVLPELIISAAEASRRGAGKAIVQEVKKKERLIGGRGEGRYLPLRVRIAAVLPLQPAVQDQIWVDTLEYLSKESSDLRSEVFDAVLDLPRDPRSRLTAHVLDPEAVGKLVNSQEQHRYQKALMEHWIIKYILGDTNLYESDWQASIDELWRRVGGGSPSKSSDLMRFYALTHERQSFNLKQSDIALWFEIPKSRGFPGPLFNTFERLASGVQPDAVDEALLDYAVARGRPGMSSFSAAKEISSHLVYVQWRSRGQNPVEDRRFRAVLMGPVVVALERGLLTSQDVAALSTFVNVDLTRLEASRQQTLELDMDDFKGIEPYGELELAELGMPPWVAQWATSLRTYLVEDPQPSFAPR
jgi:hypothetical protein